MELLREHANEILTHPITISVKPGHLVLQKGSSPWMDQSSSHHSHDTHCCQAQCVSPMAAPFKKQLENGEENWRTLEIV
jgi:hypothetical protein